VTALVPVVALLSVLPGVCPCPNDPRAEASGAHACCPSSAPELRAPLAGCCPEAADDAVVSSVAAPTPAPGLDHVAGEPAGTVRLSQRRTLAVLASSPSPILRI
jgi:hypothetical protein